MMLVRPSRDTAKHADGDGADADAAYLLVLDGLCKEVALEALIMEYTSVTQVDTNAQNSSTDRTIIHLMLIMVRMVWLGMFRESVCMPASLRAESRGYHFTASDRRRPERRS